MPSLSSLLAGAGLCLCLAALPAPQDPQPPAPPPPPTTSPTPPPTTPPPPPAAAGHLVLVIQGDARALAITHIVAKADACGLERAKSPHSIAVLDAAGRELAAYPLDLSAFDLDPAHAGRPPRVEGDRVIETKVVALASIPRLLDGTSLELRRGKDVLGRVTDDDYTALIARGVRR